MLASCPLCFWDCIALDFYGRWRIFTLRLFPMKKYFCFLGLVLAAGMSMMVFADQPEFRGFASVQSIAAGLAEQEFVPDEPLPRNLAGLDYDDLRRIRFAPREAVWRMERLPFQLQFFHPGGIQKDRVKVILTEGDLLTPVEFSRDMFEYQGVNIRGRIADDVGFSGFRVHYPLNKPDYLDELIVFQGASYFRALPQKCVYGISARALGLQIAEGQFEEFPRFRRFWIEKPGRDAAAVRIWGLLESASVVGAYEFLIRPGVSTVIDVRAALFFRENVRVLGLAPLTSMFWFGENSFDKFGDFRPEVHDSDGAMIHAGGDEWLWRPLVNDTNCFRWSSFAVSNGAAFGLFQRDRKFASYEDLEAHYHERPSVWVEPSTNVCWQAGEIRLVELPTTTEYGDNVNLFFVPRSPAYAGSRLDYAYRMHWVAEQADWPPLGRAIATRLARITYNQKAVRFLVDFSKPADRPDFDPANIEVDLAVDRGRILGSFFQPNDYVNAWRVVFDVESEAIGEPVEIRCVLRAEHAPLTETWVYQWIARNN